MFCFWDDNDVVAANDDNIVDIPVWLYWVEFFAKESLWMGVCFFFFDMGVGICVYVCG